jgi:hypothetical protein
VNPGSDKNQRNQKNQRLKIRSPGVATFNVVSNIQHYPGKKIKYERETYSQE